MSHLEDLKPVSKEVGVEHFTTGPSTPQSKIGKLILTRFLIVSVQMEVLWLSIWMRKSIRSIQIGT